MTTVFSSNDVSREALSEKDKWLRVYRQMVRIRALRGRLMRSAGVPPGVRAVSPSA